MKFRFFCLIIFFSGLIKAHCGIRKTEDVEAKTINGYYSLEDFKTVPKFDAHIHINTKDTFFMELAQRDNFRFLKLVDDRPFGLPMEGQQEVALHHLRSYPQLMAFATTFSVDQWENPDWVENTIADLKKSFSAGAKAVKIWKNIGMDLRNKKGGIYYG